jgi:hypothetical protein
MHSVKRKRIGICIVLVFSAFLMAGCSSSSGNGASSDDQILNAFYDLEEHINGLSELDSSRSRLLSGKVRDARDDYRAGNPCGAADLLAQYLEQTQTLRSGDMTATAEDLHNRGWMLRWDLLSSTSEVCEGYEKIKVDPALSVGESDNTHVSGSVSFGEPRMWTVTENGETFTQLQVPGVAFPTSPEGYPAVPVYRRFVAVPQDAEVSVSATANGAKTIRINLYPVQTQPMDADDEDLPFVKDNDAYAYASNYPQSICSVHRVGMMREVYIAEIICAAGQYNPDSTTRTVIP